MPDTSGDKRQRKLAAKRRGHSRTAVSALSKAHHVHHYNSPVMNSESDEETITSPFPTSLSVVCGRTHKTGTFGKSARSLSTMYSVNTCAHMEYYRILTWVKKNKYYKHKQHFRTAHTGSLQSKGEAPAGSASVLTVKRCWTRDHFILQPIFLSLNTARSFFSHVFIVIPRGCCHQKVTSIHVML